MTERLRIFDLRDHGDVCIRLIDEIPTAQAAVVSRAGRSGETASAPAVAARVCDGLRLFRCRHMRHQYASRAAVERRQNVGNLRNPYESGNSTRVRRKQQGVYCAAVERRVLFVDDDEV